MKVTSSLDWQMRNYSQVAPHNHRERSKTQNKNIDWSMTDKVDILNQHPLSHKKLMLRHWNNYLKYHDNVCKRQHHKSRMYGSLGSLFTHLKRSKKQAPYSTITFTFASGEARTRYEHIIHKAYPNLKLWQIRKAEGLIVNKVPKALNKRFFNADNCSGVAITDYDVHPDETAQHMGALHGQGRLDLLGHSTTTYDDRHYKPSASRNRAFIEALLNDKHDFKKIKERHPTWKFFAHSHPKRAIRDSSGHIVKDKNGKTKKHKITKITPNELTFRRAFKEVADRTICRTVGKGLIGRFPKAHLQFSFHRTNAASVSHDKWIRNKELKQARQKNARVRHQQKQNRADSRHVSYKARENRTKLQKQIKRVKLNMAKSRSAVAHQARHYGSMFSNSAEKSASNTTSSNRAKLSQSASYIVDSARSMYSKASDSTVVWAITTNMDYSNSAQDSVFHATVALSNSASISAGRAAGKYETSADNELTTTKHRLSSSADDEIDNARNSLSISAESSANSHIDYAQRSLSMSAKTSMSIANSVTDSRVRSKISANSSVASTSALSVENSFHESYSNSASVVDRNAHIQARNQTLSAHNARASLGVQAHSINSYLGVNDITSTSGSTVWYNYDHSISMATTSAFPAMKQTINSARVLASKSASNSASKEVSSSVEQISMKSAKVEQAVSSIHQVNNQTHNDDTYQGNDGNRYWSFGSAVKTFLNTTVNNIQNVVKKCKKKWNKAIQKSKKADRKLKEARRDTVAVHDYYQLLDENDPVQLDGKRKYGGNLFKALLGRYKQATDKYQKRFIKEDVQNTEKAQSDPKHINQVTEVVNANRKAQSSKPKPKPKPKPKMKTKQPRKPKQSRLRGTFNKHNPYRNGGSGYQNNGYDDSDYHRHQGSSKDDDLTR